MLTDPATKLTDPYYQAANIYSRYCIKSASVDLTIWVNFMKVIPSCSYGYIYGHTSSNNMSDSSVSDTHSGGTARTVSQQTSPSHGTHSSSQSRQDNSTTIFTALFDYVAQGEDELSLQRGETVEVAYLQR